MGGSESELPAEKAALRARMRAARSALSSEERSSAADVVEWALAKLPELERAETVLAFASFGSEIPTGEILAWLARSGRRVLVPFLTGGAMEAAPFGGPMAATSYGPLEPADRTAVDPSSVEAVLVPGLAFDRSGGRLGYGGAYFDRYLRRIQPSAPRIAIGFGVQVVDRVPMGRADERVDLVVTETGVIRCSPARAGR
ncbi:MAG TPA: 5-formyltetrahydrofolate cyclo-ligase [Actinomycetota bacterium]|jgi:5-formyltetrahydrofolate cyclo-ligase